MNLRKLLNAPNAKQTVALLMDVELITKRYEEVGRTERHEQKENQKSRDSRCPRCRAMKDKIVDRYAAVGGKGSVGGHLFGVRGRIDIETKPVNHCTNCSHEWEKFRNKTITDLSIVRVILNYLSELVRDPEGQSRFSWKKEAIEVFKGCHAEAVLMVQSKYKPSIRHPLSLRQLRTKYKSVFDTKEKS